MTYIKTGFACSRENNLHDLDVPLFQIEGENPVEALRKMITNAAWVLAVMECKLDKKDSDEEIWKKYNSLLSEVGELGLLPPEM